MGQDEPTEDDLLELFQTLDVDKNGSLDVQEMQAALRQLGLPAGASYISDLLTQYDRDKNREVQFSEFKSYVLSKEKRIRAVYRDIDSDGDGQLDAGEVHRAATALGLSVAPAEAERMVAMLDSNKDGRINYAEFRRFVVLLPGAQVRHTNILSAWIDSASWLTSMEYRLGHVPPSQPLERLLAGGVAGAVSRTVVAPLERLRTIMMADPSATRLGPVLRRMWADGGPRGLFRGNLATVMKVFPSSAIQFATYDACKDVMLHYSGRGAGDLSTYQKLLAGMVAGGTACTATYPLEALRHVLTQVSVAQGRAAGGYLAALRGTWADRGLQGLYQGYTAGLANNSIAMALAFASYEALCTGYARLRGAQPSAGEKGMLGGMAAVGVMATTMPLENVMRRLQVQGRPGFPRLYSGPLDCAAKMLRQEGVASLWRGSLGLLYESFVELRGIGGVRRYRVGE
ncbi:hypothetical protein CHLNCDRAFT_133793 [Chlorella variabilis]|uniref:EF-hand domain-containing protein n=1 Tax=Chlorella variabilis TaxID=554065 RepID=E1ZF88_CHLVA|nr:hypothetical protein CHLNCDRAFT_133793 [Chlorella variabilis]EFN55456.1 hypothetical protein CHLNCDRAFT_133793 [Chlorella variabilis]|eukprot:XP_005847558.1 hypothetical protein CHLNCDRAFT_133793 [Chlorella variabilis]